jgi:hypothetical protein
LIIPSHRRDAVTSSIVHETTHQPLSSTYSSIVGTVVPLCAAGHKVILVSSGAIGVKAAVHVDACVSKEALGGKLVETGEPAYNSFGLNY